MHEQTGVVWTILLILELIVLFNLSVKLSQLISSVSIHFLVVLFFPGTLVHELSHVLMSLLLFVPVHGISLRPDFRASEIRLGYAQIEKTDRLRRALIGLAPLLFGSLIIISGLWFFSFYSNIWIKTLAVILIFEISNTMFASDKDQEGLWGLVWLMVLIAGLIFIALNYFQVQIPWLRLIGLIYPPPVVFFLKRSFNLLLVPVVIDIALLLIPKVTRRN